MVIIYGDSGSLESLKKRFYLSNIADFRNLYDFYLLKNNPGTIMERNNNLDFEKIRLAVSILENNINLYWGALGERGALNKLKQLSDEYFVLNEVSISFSKYVYWKKKNVFVKSCKVDHIVVGPTGIFIIETKYWTEKNLKESKFLPHEQIDRANYILYIQMWDRFKIKFPVYNIVATYKKLEHIEYEFVNQLSINRLNKFILTRETTIDKENIEKLVKWLKSNPRIYNNKLDNQSLEIFENIFKGRGLNL